MAVHAFLDGRDSVFNSGIGFIEELEAKLKDAKVGRSLRSLDGTGPWTATTAGTAFKKAYEAIVLGKADAYADSAADAVRYWYGGDV